MVEVVEGGVEKVDGEGVGVVIISPMRQAVRDALKHQPVWQPQVGDRVIGVREWISKTLKSDCYGIRGVVRGRKWYKCIVDFDNGARRCCNLRDLRPIRKEGL